MAKMRALFSSTSGLGHVLPMVPLAAAMRERGHDVLWATGNEARPQLKAASFPSIAAGRPVAERQAEYRRRWPESAALVGKALPDHMFPRLFGAVSAPTMLDDLTPLLDHWQPDVVVHDAADFAAPILAAMAGVPNVTHGFGSVTPIQRVTAAAAETAPLWRAHGLEPRPFGGLYDHLYLDIYPPSMQTDDFLYIERIQLLNPVSLTADASDERRSAMTTVSGDAPRVVYLTFGTVFNINPTFAAAVEALARFKDAEIFVTVGPAGDVDAFGPQRDHVHIQRYVPQAELLPRCSAVVSHAGSGTLLGSLALGIPQVCLPQAADQFHNAEACADAGAGIALIGAEATTDAIETALRRVLTDKDFRRHAQDIGAEIEAMPPANHAAAVIEEL
jgi:UDP:flavonoid glycosyltransferase YjiC (YdhE family)